MLNAPRTWLLEEEHSILLDVIHNYVKFLRLICNRIVNEYGDYEMNKRKYKSVKTELYNFLNNHKQFFDVSECCVLMKREQREIKNTIYINHKDGVENFMRLEDHVRFFNLMKEYLLRSPCEYVYQYNFVQDSKEIMKTIKRISPFPMLHSYHVCAFFETHFLIDKRKMNTKCKNYEELRGYIKKRSSDYYFSRVSKERINELSFVYKGSVEELGDQKSCGICYDDYRVGQEICHLNCGHFYCRSCVEKWFEIPVGRVEAKYQCPYCREDCT